MTDRAVAAETLGSRLRLARERAGLPVAELAARLRLTGAQIEAIESEQYDRLPDAASTRGFVRSYAKVVGLDIESFQGLIDAALPLQNARLEPVRNIGPAFIEPSTRLPRAKRRMVAAVVAGVSILAAFSYFSNRQQDWPLQNLPARDLPSTTNSIEQASTTFNDNPGTPQQVQSPAPALVVDASLVQRSLSTAAAGPRQMKRLVLEFRDESWVEIKEQEGRTIFAQLNLGGTERVVEGTPPLSIVVGNAPAVQLTYDNSPVDLKPFTRIAVARLTLE